MGQGYMEVCSLRQGRSYVRCGQVRFIRDSCSLASARRRTKLLPMYLVKRHVTMYNNSDFLLMQPTSSGVCACWSCTLQPLGENRPILRVLLGRRRRSRLFHRVSCAPSGSQVDRLRPGIGSCSDAAPNDSKDKVRVEHDDPPRSLERVKRMCSAP